MSKRILVQAQPDHIESLSRGTPAAAIEELVWNALDAEAREIRIDLITNALGGIDAVRVSDDGTGIDVLRADATFGSLGGSWKREFDGKATQRRRLHGRHGRGRFKAFSLGTHVEWRTTASIGSELLSYRISGDISDPGAFELDSVDETGPATGTEVFVTGVRANCDALLATAETVQTLSSKFALYLKSYPDIRIYFNGIPVTPVIVQKRASDYKLTLESGAEAKLEVIEWKGKFTGAGKLVLSGVDGFELYETTPGVRAHGVSFTAYLISDRFKTLADENALVMDELNAEVRSYLDAARKTLKAHFALLCEQEAGRRIGRWMEEGSYPYALEDKSAERERFDAWSFDLAGRFDDFESLSRDDRTIVFRLLKRAMHDAENGSLKELLYS